MAIRWELKRFRLKCIQILNAGSASALAEKGYIAVYPAIRWWKQYIYTAIVV